jgi:hypothetical protein
MAGVFPATVALPLLHIVQAAARTPSVDPTVLGVAASVGGMVLARLYWPQGLTLRRLARSRCVRVAMGVLLFAAILPSVVPYDHVLPGSHVDNIAAAASAHEAHCHGAPASCADAPVAAGPGQLMFTEPIVVAPPMLAVLIVLATPALCGITPRPDTRPPQPARAAAI